MSDASRVSIPAPMQAMLRSIGRVAEQLGVHAYAVGGCVRDWLLGINETPDIDVTVEGDAIDVAPALAADLDGTLTVHPQFGTATIALRGPCQRLDVAMCRKETYAQPAAYPTVSRGTLADDLRRRDFTINAMAATVAPESLGTLIDPFEGWRDVRHQRLRILHERSFLDDPSRILRGVRFARRFDLQWEPQTERAMRDAIRRGALGWLNAGRICKELERMCEEPDPAACFGQLAELLIAAERTK